MSPSVFCPKKRCKTCGEEKSLEDFHVSRLNRLGRKTICKRCISESIAGLDYSHVPSPAWKWCGSCGQQKQGSEFSRHRRQPDGLSFQCRECQKAQHRKHYEKHKTKLLAKGEEWRQSNPDKNYEYRNRHRARMVGAQGEFSAEEWGALKRQYKYRCLRCGAFEGSLWAPLLSPDHIVPLSRGGRNTIDNIQPLCFPCNRWKRSKIIDFRERGLQMDKVWLRPPHSQGEPEQFEAKPEILVPRMVAGWSQCAPPEEVIEDVREHS